MDHERHWQRMPQYQPESWRDDERPENSGLRSEAGSRSPEEKEFTTQGLTRNGFAPHEFTWDDFTCADDPPDVREQISVLELLGRVNYRIIKGSRVYIEVDGVVYKTLYGSYWRSVFTGIEHYLLRCQQVSGSIWAEEGLTGTAVDLPIVYSRNGWTASGHSLSFMLSRD